MADAPAATGHQQPGRDSDVWESAASLLKDSGDGHFGDWKVKLDAEAGGVVCHLDTSPM